MYKNFIDDILINQSLLFDSICGGFKEKPLYFEVAYKWEWVAKKNTKGLVLSS
jgi:hypothetical protein